MFPNKWLVAVQYSWCPVLCLLCGLLLVVVECAPCRAQKYPAPVAGNVPTNVPTMYPRQGKMGGNGGKWGEMGENKETWAVQPVPGVRA